MGRPIKSSFFGSPTLPGYQIVVNGIKWADGTTSLNGRITKQTGASSYTVTDGVKVEKCLLVNATAVSGLAAGQCFILATPFGGSARPCYKIQENRLSLFSTTGSITSYSWSSVPATKVGEANLINPAYVRTATGSVELDGDVVSEILITDAGDGYTSAPTITINGDGVDATAIASITQGSVSGIIITNPGSGYTTATVTFSDAP